MKARGGITLIELAIATALLSAAAVVVAAVLAAGLRVYERTQRLGAAYGDVLVAQGVLQRDLCNTVHSRFARFEGDRHRLSIPSIVSLQSKEGKLTWPGLIRYAGGQENAVLERSVTAYTLLDKREEIREILASNLQSVEFAFAEVDPVPGRGVLWRDDWIGRTNLPAAVRIVIRFTQNGEQIEIPRTVVLSRR